MCKIFKKLKVKERLQSLPFIFAFPTLPSRFLFFRAKSVTICSPRPRVKTQKQWLLFPSSFLLSSTKSVTICSPRPRGKAKRLCFMPGKRASGEPPQANLINDIKQKRLPVFLGNTTTPYWCTARNIDKERQARFWFLYVAYY